MQEILIAVTCRGFVLTTADSREDDRNANTVQPFQTSRFIRDEEEFHRLKSPSSQYCVTSSNRVLLSVVVATTEPSLRTHCTCISLRLQSIAAADHIDADHTTNRLYRLVTRSHSMRTTTMQQEDLSTRTAWTTDSYDPTLILPLFSSSIPLARRRIAVFLEVKHNAREDVERRM